MPRVSFEDLVENYPNESQAELFRSLGGEWPDLVGNPDFENTCAIRISVAHYRSGKAIPSRYKEAQDGDGNPIILKVQTFKRFLVEEYGESDWGMSKPVGGSVSMDDLPRRTGVLAYHADWGNATGHFDLWTGNSFVGTGDLDDIKDGYAIEMWFFP